jgi:broad specificity phosphatase PhoE
MAMPEDLVLVRHGQSEANIVQKLLKDDPFAEFDYSFYDRHDSEVRLSRRGVEQAEITGDWLRQEFSEGFDRYYVSSLTRTIETAGRLAICGDWDIDDRWRERDWGEFGLRRNGLDMSRYDLSQVLKDQNKWYWCPPGGESLGTGVRLRFSNILNSLHREMSGKKVIAVTHGETMEVARVVLERMLIRDWIAQERDKNYKLSNCQTLHYSRRDPVTKILADRLEWRRSICAWDPSRSWNNGQWTHLDNVNKRYSDQDLLEFAERNPRQLSKHS